MPLRQEIKDAINANSTNTDKASYSRRTNAQAYTDSKTRDKTEDIYYRFKEAKKTKGISDSEYALIKRYFGNNEIKAQNAVIWFNPSVETENNAGSYLDDYILDDSEMDELLDQLNEETGIENDEIELEYWTAYEGTKKNIQENYNFYMMEAARTQPLYTIAETSYNASKQKAANELRKYVTQNLPVILSAAAVIYLAKEAIAIGGAIAGTAALAAIEGFLAYITQLAQEIGAEELANMGYDLYDIINEGKEVKELYIERNKAGDAFAEVKEKHDDNVKWKQYYKNILNDFDNWFKRNYGTNEISRAEKRYAK